MALFVQQQLPVVLHLEIIRQDLLLEPLNLLSVFYLKVFHVLLELINLVEIYHGRLNVDALVGHRFHGTRQDLLKCIPVRILLRSRTERILLLNVRLGPSGGAFLEDATSGVESVEHSFMILFYHLLSVRSFRQRQSQ